MRGQKLRTGLFFLAAALLSAAALRSLSLASGEDRGYSFLLKTPVTAKEAVSLSERNQKALEEAKKEEALEERPVEFVLWGQEREQTLEDADYGRRADADVVYYSGPASLLFPGNNLTEETKNGCLLDEKTAAKLFGTGNAVGRELSFGGNTYKVCGILQNFPPTLAILVTRQWITESTVQTEEAGGTGIALDHVYVPKAAGQTAAEVGKILQNSYLLSGDLMDMELLFGLFGGLLLITPLGLYLSYGMWSVRELRQTLSSGKERSSKLLAVLEAVLLAVSLWAVCRFFQETVQIPADYLPTKWSEFSFFSGLFEEKAQAVKILLGGEKGPMEWGILEKLGEAAGFGTASLTVFLLGRNTRGKGKGHSGIQETE